MTTTGFLDLGCFLVLVDMVVGGGVVEGDALDLELVELLMLLLVGVAVDWLGVWDPLLDELLDWVVVLSDELLALDDCDPLLDELLSWDVVLTVEL